MSDVAERVKKIVIEHLGVEAEKVTENASFIDDLGADSLDTVELVMAFEEEFGCEIPDDAAETILTVGDAVKFLEKNAACRYCSYGLKTQPDRIAVGGQEMNVRRYGEVKPIVLHDSVRLKTPEERQVKRKGRERVS